MRLQRADVAALSASIIWGINYSSLKIAVTYVPPFVMGMVRFLIAGIVIFALLKRIEGSVKVSWRDVRWFIIVGVVGFGIQQMCFLYGVSFLDASIVALLTAFTRTIMTVIGSFLARERLTLLMIIGLLFACVGMYGVVVGQGTGLSFASVSWLGFLLVLVAGMISAAMPLLNKHLLVRYSSLRTTTWTITIGALFLFPAGAINLGSVSFGHFPAIVWGAILFTALGATVFSNVLWNYGVANIGAVRMIIYGYLPPILGVVLATVLLRESLTAIQWAGAVLTVGGVALSQYGKQK